MRFFVFALLFGFALAGPLGHATPVHAQTSGDVEGTQEGDDLAQLEAREDETLDSLFDDLRRQPRISAANRISRKIWTEWGKSGSDSIDLLMQRVSESMASKQNNVAMDLLDQIIILAPEYAEGWNRRATLHFAMKEYGRSISDIERVLELEPRHFGALSGLAVILQGLGRKEKSLETWYKVLEIYPANEQAQNAVIKLEDELAGNPT